VQSRDKDVDPVGACVGMKGMRVQSIIRELRGEKIDIIEFSDEITTFAEKALQPAKVSRVSITDLTDKQLEVIVDDTQLSLAIGKKGQNVRLAAKLLGWKIDIKSEEEKRQEVEQQMQALAGPATTPIEQLTELGETIIQKLVTAGITTVEGLADMTPEQLEEIPGIGEKTLEKIGVAVRSYFSRFEAEATQAAEAALAAEAADAEAAAGTEADETALAGAALSEGSLDDAEPPLAGKETAEVSTEEAEAENSAEVIEEAVSEAGVEAEEESEQTDQDEIDAVGAEVIPELDASETESAQEEERPDKEGGA
jgi:N utilization substance protein A